MEELITISKSEYNKLKKESISYKEIMENLKSKEKTLKEIISEFEETNIYEDDFIKDLEIALSKSNYLNIDD